jgi:multisubunit Na+/H+ antiporter MnhB subunit
LLRSSGEPDEKKGDMLELKILLVFMILAAFIAIEKRGLLSSVIAVGAVGLGLSIAFLLLKAPDLAIVQLVVEIIVLIILIRVTAKKDDILNFSTKRDLFFYVAAILFVIMFWVIGYYVVQMLPPFGTPLMKTAQLYLDNGLKDTGTTNLVSSVAMGYRAFDSLGQILVLFAATIGIMSIMRKVGKKR